MERHEIDELLGSAVEVPRRTVFRDFPDETVALNADTGRYFGLNSTAADMLTALDEAGTVRDALTLLSKRLGRSERELELDLLEMCAVFERRGLIVLTPADGG
jgi:hypothetical protein